MLKLRDGIVELYRKVAISVPKDIEEALKTACSKETMLVAGESLDSVLNKVNFARAGSCPICEDTGFPVFFVKVPMGLSHRAIREVIVDATRLATKRVPLTPNAVSSITDLNSGDNVGDSFPLVYIDETEEQTLTVDLLLKSGQSENLGQMYKLPALLSRGGIEAAAGRDFDGVLTCVLDAVSRARGEGCPPYTIGVALGGAKDQVTFLSKKQLMRRLHDVHPDPAIAGLEMRILNEVNNLDKGSQGIAGQITALGVKIAAAHRHPESYFVDVSFACWAHRRGRLIW
ncbi:MAG TPA: fumarate hydratase [Dissulfurispiraceae bacterium]|nr:fumarate hydratase [Dissulfurispiraceae bacterium]